MLATLLKHLDMVRLSVGAVVLVAMVGCTGLIQDTGNGLTPEQQKAQDVWIAKAAPIFKAQCGACHAGSQADIAFIAGATDLDIRDTLVKFDPQVVNFDAPQSSRVLTKGAHAGPALGAQDSSDILEWIQDERDAATKGAGSGSSGPTLETTPFMPLLCTSGTAGDISGCGTGGACCPINHVDLTNLGPGLAGASIDFVAQPLSTDLYVTDLYLKASTVGVYIEHPLFVSWSDPNTPIPDPLDRYFAVKMNEMPATGAVTCPPVGPSCDAIGGGTAAFHNFTPTNALTIHFKIADIYHPASGGTGGTGATGCKVLSSFKTNVVPVMNVTLAGEGNNCAGCHDGQNGNATSAMALTGIGSATDSMVQTACNQVLTRINMQSIATSGVILAPEMGQDAAHPFKLTPGNFTTFSNGLTTWANAEKTAP